MLISPRNNYGHLSPSTSMQTYIHFADYLLALFLRRSERMSPPMKKGSQSKQNDAANSRSMGLG